MADAIVLRPDRGSVSDDLKKSSGWWGMLFLVATEAAVFAYLLFSYYYMAIENHSVWPSSAPSMKLALPNTIILLVSSVTVWWADRQYIAGRMTEAMGGLAASVGLGVVFFGMQLIEWHNKTFTLASDPYGSLYFTITGFHMAHVVVGLVIMATLILWLALGHLSDRRNSAVSIAAIYWHFVDAVWLTVFFTFYITPYLS